LLAFRDYLEYSLKMAGVEIRIGAAATAQTILSLAPDKVIIAVGTRPAAPLFKGGTLTSFAEDLLADFTPVPMNKRVAIIGGGTVGCETALYLHGFGNTLSIIEQTDVLAKGQQSTHRTRDLALLKEYGVALHLGCTVLEVNGKGVLCNNGEDREFSIPADVTLTACGQTLLGTALYENLRAANVPTVLVGSCAGTLNIRTSVAMGFAAGYEA
jgi:pyruvate/2-oxoglutarate dehydrogenase complex dihydrolipoamide dehydrogenase (E3) component